MTLAELELKYSLHVKRRGALALLPADEAICFLGELVGVDAIFHGVEAFRLLENGNIQPSLEFSNISYGQVGERAGKVAFQPDFGLRSEWRSDPLALEHSMEMIRDGAAAGYTWYEVHVEEPATNEALFSRADSTLGN